MGQTLTDTLQAFLTAYPATAYVIAYSGGLDSHVLLHACAKLSQQQPQWQFRAVHIDHGLQADSLAWAQHCQCVCAQLAVPLTVRALHLQIPQGASLEAVARNARYAVFAEYLQAGEILLTAHHQDDQAETLLLHLLRGSGMDGLAAMPVIRSFAQGHLGRPWLACSRKQLQQYALQHQLVYIQDPSNADCRFDRNFLRQQVMPLLQQRWPAVSKTLARAARLQGENRTLLAEMVAKKYLQIVGNQPSTLSVQKLTQYDQFMQKALLRHWLSTQGLQRPEDKQLQQILQLLKARPDASPCVSWAGCEVRRYQDNLYVMPPLRAHDPTQYLKWQDIHQPLWIESLQQYLQPDLLAAWQAYLQQHPQPVTVRFRQGGETLWIPYRRGHHSVKHLLQEAGIPPWQRQRLPLLYIGERLIGIIGVIQIKPGADDEG